jgi:hypothetical protein
MTYSEFVRQVVFYEMNPWGDDWKQTAKIVSLIFATKGFSVPEEDIIPTLRRKPPNVKFLANKLVAGLKAINEAFFAQKK